ncbi:hypothetical protein TWF281_006575 [Arthrobotrys megalospora]
MACGVPGFIRTILLVVWVAAIADAMFVQRQTALRQDVLVIEDIKFTSYNVWDDTPNFDRSARPAAFRNVYGFFVNVDIGTPPQNVALRLSGGFRTLIPRAGTFADDPEACEQLCRIVDFYGGYDEAASSTARDYYNNTLRDISTFKYPIESYSGHYRSDTLSLNNNTTIKNFTFLAEDEFYNTGELGLSLWNGNRTSSTFYGAEFLRRLFNAGLTGIMGFAMHYAAYDINSSQITFGAVDTRKYAPPMVTYDWPSPNLPMSGNFMTTNISLSIFGSVVTFLPDQLTVISLGQPTIWLPLPLLNMILSAAKATERVDDRLWAVSCDRIRTLDISLFIELRGVNFTLEASDFIGIAPIPESEDSPSCRVFLESSWNDTGVAPISLGIPFLRKAYVWFDYQNNQTSIARANQRALDSNLVRVREFGITDVLDIIRYEAEPRGSSEKLPLGAIIGGAVGGLFLLGVIAWLIFWLRRRVVPLVPPVPVEEVEGVQRFELGANHGRSELAGSEGVRFQGPDDGREAHWYPTELPTQSEPVGKTGRRSSDNLLSTS